MGRVFFGGGKVGMVAPSTGIVAGELAVGSVVKLMESGSPVEYMVVHQGLPGSMYDASCNGTWLLRKDIKENRKWHSSDVSDYKNSTIHSYLNSTFYNLFDEVSKSAIKQVKIPYVNGATIASVATGSSGLSANVFLLSSAEVGFNYNPGTSMPEGEGVELAYFAGSADADEDERRIAKLNTDKDAEWFFRSPYNEDGLSGKIVGYTHGGGFGAVWCTYEYGIRPALILHSNALFDKNTVILKGVA